MEGRAPLLPAHLPLGDGGPPVENRNQPEETVVVHRAQSWTEAVVIRGLLESAGIDSPPLTRTDPFPMSEPRADFPGVEVLARESQVEDARKIITEYIAVNKSLPPDPPSGDSR